MNILAVIVNFFIPGIGSFIVGKGGAGVAQLLLFIVGLFLIVTVLFSLFGFIMVAVAWIWGLITAANANNTQKVTVVEK